MYILIPPIILFAKNKNFKFIVQFIALISNLDQFLLQAANPVRIIMLAQLLSPQAGFACLRISIWKKFQKLF